MSFTPRWRPVALLFMTGVVALGACSRDEGPGQLAHAEAKYRDLVERGIPPRDPAYDAVIAELEAIPEGSRARPEAERRLAALRALRSPLPPRPLGRPGAPGDAGRDEHSGHAHGGGTDGGA